MNSKWTKVKLKDICRNVSKTEKNPLELGLERYIGLEHIDPESLKINRWGFIEDGISFTKKFEKGQILFGKRRSYQKKAAIAEFDGICSGDILVFGAIEDKIVPGLLPYIIQNDKFFDYSVGTSSGSISPRTNWKHLGEYEINVPNKALQLHILDKLNLIEDCIQKSKVLLDTSIKYRTKLLKRIFYSQYDNKKKLRDIVEITKGKKPKKIYDEPIINSKPYILVDTCESKKNMQYTDDKTCKTCKNTDILIVWDGSRAGKVFEGLDGYIGSTMAAIKLIDKKVIYERYLLYYLKYKEEYIQSKTKGTGIPHVDNNIILNLVINIPEKSIQTKYVNILDELENNIECMNKNINNTIKLRKSILNKLMENN